MTESPAKVGGFPPSAPFQAVIPVLLFVAVNRVAGLRWAVVIATIWSVKVLVDRRRRGHALGVFMPVVTAAVLVRGAIGAITESETLYFGLGIATKYVVAGVLILSLLLGRPLAHRAAPYIFTLTPAISGHSAYRSAMSLITLIGGLYYAVSATFDVWLLRRSSVEGFVLVRFLANWPLSALALGGIVAISHRKLTQIPTVTSLPALAEARLSQYWAGEDEPESPGAPQ